MRDLQNFGAQQRYGLFAIKDASAAEDSLWTSALMPNGFTRLPGLPTAVLDLPYQTFDEYLASLSRATRKDMRRKLKTFKDVRIEQRRCIDDVIEEVAHLYGETVARSDLQFEYLPQNYFSEILH